MSEALEPCPALTRQHNDLPVRLFVNAMPPHLHYIVRRKKEGINGIQAGVYVCAWYHTIPAVVYYYLLQLWDKKKKRDNALFVEDSQTPSMVLRRQHHHATQAKSRRAGKKKNGALNVVAGTCARARVAFMGTCAACLPGTADMLAPPATGRAVAMAMAMH